MRTLPSAVTEPCGYPSAAASSALASILLIDGEEIVCRTLSALLKAEADLVRYAEDLEVAKSVQEEHGQRLARLVEELAQESDLPGTVMDDLPDYIFYKDRQSRFLRTNPGFAKMLGLSDPREAVGKTDFDFFPVEDAKAYFSDEQHVVETGQPLIGRVERVRQPDGQYRWHSTSTVPKLCAPQYPYGGAQ